MQNAGWIVRAILVTSVAAASGCAVKPVPQPDDGLVRVETAMLDELYVAPEVSLAHYKRVMVDPIEVEFAKDWRSQHPDMSNHDFELFRDQLASKLHETLVAELARGGYVLAESPDQDVIRLKARIEDADFPAPEMAAAKSTATYVDGKMTLRVQGFDGPSGALVARARDHQEDPEPRRFDKADRVSAMINAQKIFDDWASELRSAMDVAKVRAGARTPNR